MNRVENAIVVISAGAVVEFASANAVLLSRAQATDQHTAQPTTASDLPNIVYGAGLIGGTLVGPSIMVAGVIGLIRSALNK